MILSRSLQNKKDMKSASELASAKKFIGPSFFCNLSDRFNEFD